MSRLQQSRAKPSHICEYTHVFSQENPSIRRRRRRDGGSNTKPVLSQASPRPDARVGWPARRDETCKLPLYRACRWLCLLDFDVSLRSSPFVRPCASWYNISVVYHAVRSIGCRFLTISTPSTCPGKSDSTSSTPRVRRPDLELSSKTCTNLERWPGKGWILQRPKFC